MRFLTPTLTLLSATVAAQVCYWPDGSIAKNLTSCNVAAAASTGTTCCNTNSVCLSNGFCLNEVTYGNRIARQGCTDKNWGSGCAQACKDIFVSGQSSLILTGDFDPGTYCCGNLGAKAGECMYPSGGSLSPFRGPANGAVIWDRKTGSTDLDKLLALGVDGGNGNATETVTMTVTASTSGTGTASIPANNTGTSGNAGGAAEEICPKSNEVVIGAGVGGGMAAVLAAVGALLFWQIKKRREAEKRVQEMMHQVSSPGHYDVGNAGDGGGNGFYAPVKNEMVARSELPGDVVGGEMRG